MCQLRCNNTLVLTRSSPACSVQHGLGDKVSPLSPAPELLVVFAFPVAPAGAKRPALLLTERSSTQGLPHQLQQDREGKSIA